jgi:predicted amino acid racemase
MRIVCDCEKIRRNAEVVTALCAPHDIAVVGVTKCVCGEPAVGRAMMAGGCAMLAESRLDNIRRLREGGVDAPVMLLRLPALSEVDDVVALAQYSLVSEVETGRALAGAADRQGLVHRALLMVETGDRREGFMPDEAVGAAQALDDMPGLELAGVATTLNCLCGVLPTPAHQQYLVDALDEVEAALGRRLEIVSGGHTGNLHLIKDGRVPARFNQVRVGEAILTGTDFSTWADLGLPHQDVFKAYAEVIEVKDKPSAPDGAVGRDAFMRVHEWPDRGVRRRAILALGEIDLDTASLKPVRPGVELVGASSDHLVVDVTDALPPVRLGEELEFDTLYPAASTGWSSTVTTKVALPMREPTTSG